MNRIVVAGCSFSDWSKVENNYGEYLASKLNIPVKFFTSGCGSNQRIWRTLTKSIIEKEITGEDILIVQYTTPERKEFWSRLSSNDPSDYTRQGNTRKGSAMREAYLDGELIKFKADAYKWQSVTQEKTFFKLLEDTFLSSDFETELFNTNSFMFQALLKEFKIKTIFLETCYTRPWSKLECEFHYFLDIKPLQVRLNCQDDYCSHLTEEGHKNLGNYLADFIEEVKWQKQL